MGGDGGVIASNRKYMRGAGTANHTADGGAKHQQQESSAKEVQQELMSVCYLTKAPLNFKTQQIVADAYGRLYNKEAAVEALLRRRLNSSVAASTISASSSTDELGSHIRGLKDLVTLHVEISSSTDGKPICPVTNVELNGVNPAVLLPNYSKSSSSSSSRNQVNVLAERSIKEMGKEALREEYGDGLDHTIRLAPPPSMMEEIKKKVQEQHDQEKALKAAASKSKKKRTKSDNNDDDDDEEEAAKKKKKKQKKLKQHQQHQQAAKSAISGSGSVTNAARQRVRSAVQSNEILSSLFATNSKNISEKERADNLFARG